MRREFLITKFCCAKCGMPLEVSNDVPPSAGSHYSEGEPTGAAMARMMVAVVPCQNCFAPLEAMKDAARVLLQGAK